MSIILTSKVEQYIPSLRSNIVLQNQGFCYLSHQHQALEIVHWNNVCKKNTISLHNKLINQNKHSQLALINTATMKNPEHDYLSPNPYIPCCWWCTYHVINSGCFINVKVTLIIWKRVKIWEKMLQLTNNLPFYINPLTPKISLVILLTVCHTIHMILIWRIWYWINQ